MQTWAAGLRSCPTALANFIPCGFCITARFTTTNSTNTLNGEWWRWRNWAFSGGLQSSAFVSDVPFSAPASLRKFAVTTPSWSSSRGVLVQGRLSLCHQTGAARRITNSMNYPSGFVTETGRAITPFARPIMAATALRTRMIKNLRAKLRRHVITNWETMTQREGEQKTVIYLVWHPGEISARKNCWSCLSGSQRWRNDTPQQQSVLGLLSPGRSQ